MLKAFTEAATGGGSIKKVFLKVSQNSQENACARASFLIKLQAPVNFAKFLRTPILIEHIRWLLLKIVLGKCTIKLMYVMPRFF